MNELLKIPILRKAAESLNKIKNTKLKFASAQNECAAVHDWKAHAIFVNRDVWRYPAYVDLNNLYSNLLCLNIIERKEINKYFDCFNKGIPFDIAYEHRKFDERHIPDEYSFKNSLKLLNNFVSNKILFMSMKMTIE